MENKNEIKMITLCRYTANEKTQCDIEEEAFDRSITSLKLGTCARRQK